MSMPITLPPLAWGPRLWHATCSQEPGLHPRSSTLAPGLQRNEYIQTLASTLPGGMPCLSAPDYPVLLLHLQQLES